MAGSETMTNAMPDFGLRRGWSRKKGLRGVLLLALLLLGLPAVARSAPSKLELARSYFEKARNLHAEFEKIPVAKRAEKDYVRLMEAYRRVYFTAPTYGNDTICLMAIAQLAEEAAPRFDKPQYLQKAIDSYEFLLREYPHSQFRFEALLSIARIYDEDLSQPEKALQQYERYLKTFPGSAQARGVKETMALLRKKLDLQAAERTERVPIPPDDVLRDSSPAQGGTESGSKSATATSQQPSGRARISDIRFWRTKEFTRVVLEMGRQVKYNVGRVESPDRLYLDLLETRVSPPSGRTLEVEDDMLRSIRVAQFNTSTSRVVLDLAERTEFAISELTNPYRLVVDISNGGAQAAAARADLSPAPKVTQPGGTQEDAAIGAEPVVSARQAMPPEPGTKTLAAVSPAEDPGPSSEPGVSAKQPVEAPVEIADAAPDRIKAADPIAGGAHSLTRALGLKIGRILIDPGHGGHDTGTIGPAGYMEKELVLDVAQRLGELIEQRLGSEVIYTRGSDKFISLEERARMANKQQADLFLSIHANSSRSKTAMGIETYYLSLTADPEALEVAARENAVAQETISELQGLVSKIALSEKVDESREFAEKIQASMRKSLAKGKGRKFDRGVKKAPFVVLIGVNMPAILAEISFLSNPEEEKRLKTEKHRQQIAEALFEGVSSYADTLSGVKASPTRAGSATEPTQTASLE